MKRVSDKVRGKLRVVVLSGALAIGVSFMPQQAQAFFHVGVAGAVAVVALWSWEAS